MMMFCCFDVSCVKCLRSLIDKQNNLVKISFSYYYSHLALYSEVTDTNVCVRDVVNIEDNQKIFCYFYTVNPTLYLERGSGHFLLSPTLCSQPAPNLLPQPVTNLIQTCPHPAHTQPPTYRQLVPNLPPPCPNLPQT